MEAGNAHNMEWCKCGKIALDYHPIWLRVAYTIDKDGNFMYEKIKG